MPKIIFDTKNEIPEHLRNQVTENTDGKFEIDAKGVLDKNKELLKDNSKLRETNESLTADLETAKTTATEWKGKAKLPAGHKIVADDVADLGEAAKEAGLLKDEMPTLKTSKEDLQKQIDSLKGEKVIDEVAKANKLNNRFKLTAKDKGWKFESATEKDADGKDKTVWNHIGADGAKTKVETFFETDEYAKEFYPTFKEESDGNTWVNQESGKDAKPPKNLAEQHMAKRYTGLKKKD